MEGQESLFTEIDSLLHRLIFDGIQVESGLIPKYYSMGSKDKDHETARLYLRMLKACMIREHDFRIVVGRRPDSWCYLGDEKKNEGVFADRFLQISREKLDVIFPAVAIMGRMVMVPVSFHSAFDGSAQMPWFLNPLDLQGVTLVDFGEPDFVHQKVEQVGAQLEQEIIKLCARHAHVRNIQVPDFNEMSRLLSISSSYFIQHQEKIMRSFIRMTPRVLSGSVQVKRPSQVILGFTEASENPLRRVQVWVIGPRGTLQSDVRHTVDFTAGDANSQLLTFEVVAKVRPYCPLEIHLEPDGGDNAYAAFSVPLILDVR